MDAPIFATLVTTTIALAWVGYYAIGVWQESHTSCICGHIHGRHVSPRDWDSDYGNPGRMGGAAAYQKPGKCRDCFGRCNHFIPVPAGNGRGRQ